ncbi:MULTISPECIES: helix-turn-helix domain-containing protein [Rhodanobacter]|uniref:helix-turn-helix domain-containing protein n=2 Tax=Rhodanobacteraceae TaxID=1775411 RepID=UPI001F33E1A1|nr:helix-turn-helix domain-containing protein [Rhodanobacter thiooxydans]UJJ55939.1 helix-turn-helix domain-containing protein [Rhodanobacter thiooxydans]
MSHIRDTCRQMSYIRDMMKDAPFARLARQLGASLRAQRKQLGLTQIEVAHRAGIGRQKLIQVEQGKPGVALAAYAATMDALDLVPTVKPAEVRIAEYPQLMRLTWNRPGADMIAERDALALYERHWDLVDADQMTAHERSLLQRLVGKYGQGILHV